jgi:hypothetical protein
VAPVTTYADGNGMATTSWTVGLGANVCEASIEGRSDIAPVQFAARGDGTASPPATGDTSGCGCRSTGAGAGGIPLSLLLLLPVLAVRALRRPAGSA